MFHTGRHIVMKKSGKFKMPGTQYKWTKREIIMRHRSYKDI